MAEVLGSMHDRMQACVFEYAKSHRGDYPKFIIMSSEDFDSYLKYLHNEARFYYMPVFNDGTIEYKFMGARVISTIDFKSGEIKAFE